MKWPKRIAIIRHGESAFNAGKTKKESDPLYQDFRQSFDRDPESPETIVLAKKIWERTRLGVGDYETPLTSEGRRQAHHTGINLGGIFREPDVVFLSPYIRTVSTFGAMHSAYQALFANVPVVYDDRIREQEHGLQSLYNDRRVFHALHPEQRRLYDLLGPYWYQYPQGESVSQVRDRVRSFFDMLIREYAERNVLIVTHHLTILSIRSLLERWTPERFMEVDRDEKPVNCGVTILHGNPDRGRNGKLEIEVYNQKLYPPPSPRLAQ